MKRSCPKVSLGIQSHFLLSDSSQKADGEGKGTEEGFGVLGSLELGLRPPSNSRENERGCSPMAGIQSPQFSHSPNTAVGNDSPIKVCRVKHEH